MKINADKIKLEELYGKYNHRRFVHPDPLEFLYNYEYLHDREIVGLVASSLAYGRVEQILKSVSSVLERMQEPSYFLKCSSMESLRSIFRDFKHRFTTGEDLATLLYGAKRVIEKYGSLYECFRTKLNDDPTIFPALKSFMTELSVMNNFMYNSLVPSPLKGSACKRMNLFLRWMVRKDNVDPGGWDDVPASKLIVPLDTHLYRICCAMNLSQRKQADMKTAFEITNAFRTIAPEDPVKYDFALTRLGMRGISPTWKIQVFNFPL
ncbi:MAG: TIGR02757 family protein [bacterium]